MTTSSSKTNTDFGHMNVNHRRIQDLEATQIICGILNPELVVFACILMLTHISILQAQEKQETSSDKSRTTLVIESENFTNEEKLVQEHLALEFAEAHHAELAKLLKNLKKHDPQQYNKGITEIRRTMLRLDKIRDKLPERYDRELQLWRVNSQIRLQVARILISAKPDDHDQLTALLTEKRQLEISYLQAELERLTAETEKMEDRKLKLQNELQAKESDLPDWVKQEKERLLKAGKSSVKSGEKNTTKNKPATKAINE